MRPSSRRSGRVSETPSSPWGTASTSPRSHGPIHLDSSPAPTPDARASSSDDVSSPARPHRSTATMGPVSSPASISISVTPVSVSPSRIVDGIGVAPRWRGRSDGWTFRIPWAGISSSSGGMICP